MQYRLFANCIPVVGASRSTICDLQRKTYVLVPNSLISMFDENYVINFEVDTDLETLNTINSYKNFLLENELIHPCSTEDIGLLPKLNLDWDYPAKVSNIIIDISEDRVCDYNLLFSVYFDEVNCRYVQLRCYHEWDFNEIQEIISIINKTPIRAVDFIIKDSKERFSHQQVVRLVNENRKIRTFTLHSSIENKLIQNESFGFGLIVTIKEEITSEHYCGIIHPTYFTSSVEFFTESQHYNTCLNRKVAIDKHGNIKNCPSMLESFGNINNTTLLEAISKPGFTKYWNVSKDEIFQCRDCEFRHVCTDCRAYVENPNDMYSKPLKCGYNPYTNIWDEWSNNPLKKNAIEFYNLLSLIKD